MQKKFIVRDMTVNEVSTVDTPAQKGAVAVLIKSAGPAYDAIRRNAAEVVSGCHPIFAVSEYEDAMFVRSDQIGAQYGISSEQALSLYLSRDRELMELAYASEAARAIAHAERVRKRGWAA